MILISKIKCPLIIFALAWRGLLGLQLLHLPASKVK